MEGWLLAPLSRALARQAPRMSLISVPVQFRTVGDALAARAVDLAVTVADELPRSVRREPLLQSGFVCLFDPRHVRAGRRMSEHDYFAHAHVIVSYNGDLRGIVEDTLGRQRRVRCAVSSFSHVGAVVEGSALLATVPSAVVRYVQALHPRLRTAELPFALPSGGIEMLWLSASDDDEACRFVRAQIAGVTRAIRRPKRGGAALRGGVRA
jgi:LysR family transcriptional activator of mexEF-oprN operon